MSQKQRGSISQHSTVQLSNDLDEVSNAELIKLVADIKKEIKVLALENEVLEKTLTRLDPSLLVGIQQALDYANKIQSGSSLNVNSFIKSQNSKFGFESLASPSRMLTSPSKVSTRRVESSVKLGGTIILGTGPRINILEKSELVDGEMQVLMNALDKARNKAAKQHALLKAQLEEIATREVDIAKASDAFQQQVIIDGWDRIAQRIPAEVWIRFMAEWMKIMDRQIGKLRLRTSTLNAMFAKYKGQIKIKAELSESLRPVDFDKLKIENNECEEIIEKKFQQLQDLKAMTGEANLNLTIHKNLLVEQNEYLSSVVKTIKDNQVRTVSIDKETDVIKIEADNLAQRLEDVRKVRMAWEVPDVINYVTVKAELTDLKHTVKLFQNRAHIQSIALASLTKKIRAMKKKVE